ncbi:hypothetical protein F4803DRAFT_515814 [Xylaria telfairii]|nr:hypothetical protein F4803DRAFT_515814 [Xylaria telfairii]
MSAILRFPYELHVQIASDKTLERNDLAALRLVCRCFASPAASVLFRCVKMSRLKKDKDSLEHIAASEHLAQHVRELVWYELNLEAWFTPEEEEDALSLGLIRLPPSSRYNRIRQLMADVASDTSVFWFPRLPFNDGRNFARLSVGSFVATLGKFPRLTSFVSCPMPWSRDITYNESQIRCGLYRTNAQRTNTTSNCGFFSYMLEAMKHAQSNVQTLSWQDENTNYTNLGRRILCTQIDAFKGLTTIDLSPTIFSQEQCDWIVLCLKAAINLKHLSLCYERRHYEGRCPLISGLVGSCAWTSLTSIEFSYISFSKYRMMVPFLAKCTGLRQLYLRECLVYCTDIMALRQLPSRQFTSIVITGKAEYCYLESSLLDYVNRISDVLIDSDKQPIRVTPRDGCGVCTVQSPDDNDLIRQHKPHWSRARFDPDGDLHYWQADDFYEDSLEYWGEDSEEE